MLPTVTPMPATVSGIGGFLGAGPQALRDPTGFLVRQRARHGDTFVVDAFGRRLFLVFSPRAVARLYAVAEEEASFGLATYRMISHKAPDELFDGRRVTPHQLFGSQNVEGYLAELDGAMDAELELLGSDGTFEVFAEMRRLAHRMGLASWAGEAADPQHLDRLMPLFDRLDMAESFVHPTQMIRTWATRKRSERAAMIGIESIIGEVLDQRRRDDRWPADWLTHIWEAFADLDLEQRRIQVARDIIVIHLGSLSNLYAAMAWSLIDLLGHPDALVAARAGDDTLIEIAASESIRMAQRSITLREVLRPIEVDDGTTTYRLEPGVMLATMLGVTNSTAARDLSRWDPAHYVGRKLAPGVDVATRELVSTFGHGSHTCPAARFSISSIRIAVRRLIDTYDLDPNFVDLTPLRGQLGGVARASRPAVVTYRRRGH